jgi:hypothetical protein
MNKISILRPSTHLVASVRGELRDRRSARVNRRSLQRQLSAYTTTSDVNDLLGSIRGQDDRAAQEIREIVLRNQMRHGLHRAS